MRQDKKCFSHQSMFLEALRPGARSRGMLALITIQGFPVSICLVLSPSRLLQHVHILMLSQHGSIVACAGPVWWGGVGSVMTCLAFSIRVMGGSFCCGKPGVHHATSGHIMANLVCCNTPRPSLYVGFFHDTSRHAQTRGSDR